MERGAQDLGSTSLRCDDPKHHVLVACFLLCLLWEDACFEKKRWVGAGLPGLKHHQGRSEHRSSFQGAMVGCLGANRGHGQLDAKTVQSGRSLGEVLSHELQGVLECVSAL